MLQILNTSVRCISDLKQAFGSGLISSQGAETFGYRNLAHLLIFREFKQHFGAMKFLESEAR